MTIQQLFNSSRSLAWAASMAVVMPLIFNSGAAVAQNSRAEAKPQSNREALQQINLSGTRGAPSRRFGGGSRVGNGRIQNVCAAGPQAIAMIAPDDNVTVTTADQPSLMLWVNESKQERDLEFVLRDSNGDDSQALYSKILKLSTESGLVTVDMSQLEDAPSLTKGENYYAYFSLVCDPSDRSKDMVVEGQISAVDFEQWAASASQFVASRDALQTMNPFFQVEQFLELGLWHDAMVQLNHLRQVGATSAIQRQAQQRWQELLEADEGLNVIADETANVMSPLAISDVPEWDIFNFE